MPDFLFSVSSYFLHIEAWPDSDLLFLTCFGLVGQDDGRVCFHHQSSIDQFH